MATQQKVACFLCNVYDKYDDPGFRDPDFEDSNNDDIGEPLSIFQVTSPSYSYSSASDFKNNIESLFSATEDSSIEDIYQFTLGDRSILMRPAQIKNLTGFNDVGFYDNIVLSWELQDYSADWYQNPASGINILNSAGSIVATVSGTATGTSFHEPDEDMTFSATAFNSSGNSYNAPTVEVPAGKIADGQATDGSNLQVTVQPNPASGSVKVCVEDLPARIPVVVDVVNQMGESVATLYNATPDAELGLCLSLDCSTLPSGNYYADLQTGGFHHAVKFTVEH